MISAEAPLSNGAQVARCKHVNSAGSQRIAAQATEYLFFSGPPLLPRSLLHRLMNAFTLLSERVDISSKMKDKQGQFISPD